MSLSKSPRDLERRRFSPVNRFFVLIALLAGFGGSNMTAGLIASANAQSAGACEGPSKVSPKRLRVSGRKLIAPEDGCPVALQGVNLRDNLTPDGKGVPILTAAEADDLVKLGFNFVRLRISNEGTNVDKSSRPHESRLTSEARRAINDAIGRLKSRRIWILLEMRTDDGNANSSAFYDPNSDAFKRYKDTWVWLAKTYKKTDYIAGYGLLAEPSSNRDAQPVTDPTCLAKGLTWPVCSLIGFQASLMQAITKEDALTPFFVGPAWNYDTMGYRWDDYYTDDRLNPYAAKNRLVYEVNMLSPKPWIVDGKGPNGIDPGTWGATTAVNFGVLQSVKPTESYSLPNDAEVIFNTRSREPENFSLLMNANYVAWYLGYADRFAARHNVPVVVDQFGASTIVNQRKAGQQLEYEAKIIEVAKSMGVGWSRWLYSTQVVPDTANPNDRSIAGNPNVYNFYLCRDKPPPCPKK